MKDADGAYRLLAAGILSLTPEGRLAPSAELYRRYLARHLRPDPFAAAIRARRVTNALSKIQTR